MRTIGIELCDAGILAATRHLSEERIINLEADDPDSPAYVYFDGKRFICGKEAENLCRIHPRLVSDACWDQLSLRKSGIDANGKTPVFSELAFHHLEHVWNQLRAEPESIDKVTLALPGDYLQGVLGDEEKIGLLLGMAADLGMPLTGLIDMACASLLPHAHNLAVPDGKTLHLDLLQHTAIITEIRLDDNLQSRNVLRATSLGYSQFLADLVPKLANRFLSQTAFDVTHSAQTEQAFFCRTVGLLRSLKTATEAIIELEGQKRPRKMVVSRDMLSRFLDGKTSRLAQIAVKAAGEPARSGGLCLLVLSERAWRIPGLKDKLEVTGKFQLISLPEGAAAVGAARFGQEATVVKDLADTPIFNKIPMVKTRRNSQSRGSASSRHATEQSRTRAGATSTQNAEGTSVDVPIEESPVEEEKTSAQTGQKPTHIVLDGVAHPLVLDAEFLIGTSLPDGGKGLSIPREHSGIADLHCRIRDDVGRAKLKTQNSDSTYLNQQPVKGEVHIKAGDVLTLGTGKNRLDLMFIFCATR